MFGNLAHGGAFIAGKPWDSNGVNAALGQDYGSSQPLVDSKGNPKPSVNVIGAPGCPDYLLNNHLCDGQVLFHGDHTAIDTDTGGGTNDGAQSNLGVPLFNGWPLWTSTVHQQVYYKWLERAWLGGLRLMVMLAVSNEALCKSGTKLSTANCMSSMDAIDNQIQAAKDFQTWLDTKYGGTGKGWFQIVTTPQQAQSVIGQGKLAVVLGIEVDNIFNCHETDASGNSISGEGPNCANDPTYAWVTKQLNQYYATGVRVIFPIHDFDNAFGPTATWQDAINVGNRVGEGAWQNAINCPVQPEGANDGGYGFHFDTLAEHFILLAGFFIGADPPIYPAFSSGSCSATGGLTAAGLYLTQQAMNMGFIIDVDHEAIGAFTETMQVAASKSYAGISASHVQFFDLYKQNYPGTGNYGRHERMRTLPQLQEIANAGGMIGVMLKDDAQDTTNGWCLPSLFSPGLFRCPFGSTNATGGDFTYNYNGSNAPSNNNGALSQNCLYSTTETALQYLYGVKAMNGAGGVALGSDFMGIAGHVGPRFGNGACGGKADQRATQEFAKNRLQYPFTLAGVTFGQQVSGQKIYDFNVDGLAHIGLFPDMIADMKQVGVTSQQLQPLFSSAQAYINMWTAVYKTPAPNVTLSGVPTTPTGYLSRFTVTTNNNQTTTSVPSISASGACSIISTTASGTTVQMTSGTGTCSVTATWAADGTWAAATIGQIVTAATIPPAANFTAPPGTEAFNSTFTVTATTNASTTATITSSGGCTNNGTSVTMTSGTVTCSLTAAWAADNNYNAVSLNLAITAGKISQTVSFFEAPQSAPYKSTFRFEGITNSSEEATITMTGPCELQGGVATYTPPSTTDPNAYTTGVIHMTGGTGTCVMTATWPGDSNYNSVSLNQTTIASKITPNASFVGGFPATVPYGSSFNVSPATNASTTATLTVDPGSVCSINKTTGTITMTSGTGYCFLVATWPGDSNFLPASVYISIAASKIQPTVSFTGAPPQPVPYGSSFMVAASTNASTLAQISGTAGVCSANGTKVTMTSGTGTCLLTATFVADGNYSAATLTQRTAAQKVPLAVTANNAAITFGQAIPTFTASFSGFVGTDNQSVLSGMPSLTTTATPFSVPGYYTITAALGTLASANYSFPTFNNGTLTINASGAVPPSGNACNGFYLGGTFSGNINVAPNQVCEIYGGVVNGHVMSTGGVVSLLSGTTVSGNVNITGTATGPGATLSNQVCGATVKGNLAIQNDGNAITVGGTNCGPTAVGGNLQVQSDAGAVSIASTSISGNMTVQDNTSTVLLSGNTVSGDMQVQNNTDAAANATQVLNNQVTKNLLCIGNSSITGQGNTAKSKQGQCATF
jgi:microsomal dipeptidase-like Zn-dependent dipeptidase